MIHTSSRFASFIAVLLALPLIFLTSCSSDKPIDLRPGEGGKYYGGTFRVNETDGIKTLDPVGLGDAPSHHVVHQIAEGLVDINSDLELFPRLAKKWELSEDQLTYTYHLRTDVFFHDDPCFPDGKGRKMNASDVKFCYDRMVDVRSKTKGADFFKDKVVGAQEYFDATADSDTPVPEGGVKGFRVIDDSTFAVDLIRPFSAFKYYPALGFCYIYPEEAVNEYGDDFFRNLVATGPFVFKSWELDKEVILERNPNYWMKDSDGNQLPFLDGIRISFIKDQSTMLTEFKAGNLDENYRIPNEFVESVFEERKPGSDEPWTLTDDYSKYQLFEVPALSVQYYGFLTTGDIFNDKRIRQAFSYAIDRERIIAYVLKGQAFKRGIHGIVPPSMPRYPVESVEGYDFQPEKAKQLLADAGYPNGKGLPPITLQYNEGGGRNSSVAERIQQELKENLGLQIELQMLQWPQHTDKVEQGEADFYRLGWIADYPDPENFLNLLYGENAMPIGQTSYLNSTRYSNPEFDALFEQALRTPDDEKRYELYAEAEQIAVNDAPMMWIFYDLDFRLVQPWIEDYKSNAMDRRDYTDVWINPAKLGADAGAS